MTIANHHDNLSSVISSPSQLLDTLRFRIDQSWQRCASSYRLDHDVQSSIRIVTSTELREYQQRMEDFLRVANGGVRALHERLSAFGYIAMLVDHTGTALSVYHNDSIANDCRRMGLVPGARWDEAHNGTTGVGTSIVDQQAVLVHKEEHFLQAMRPLSCSACPIFDGEGKLIACLNITSIDGKQNKKRELITFQLVKMFAKMIENSFFKFMHRNNFILNFGADHSYFENPCGCLIALDDHGSVISANQSAKDDFIWPNNTFQRGLHINDLGLISSRDVFESSEGNFHVQLQSNSSVGSVHVGVHRPASYFWRTSSFIHTKITQKNNKSKDQHIPTLAELQGQDTFLIKTVSRLKRAINRDIPLLITGETGAGKEAFAQAIHNASQRSEASFIAMNCAAIPESLIESELFGYESGSFTGARRGGMKGKLLQAQNGTLFLDEIGDMPYPLQTRLLRVLAEREVVPLGGSQSVALDLQIIAATHQDLKDKIRTKAFREDLFYRLNGMTVQLPPVRDRSDKVELLHKVFSLENNHQDVTIERAALTALASYCWPGNIREVKNVARLALAFADDCHITLDCLPDGFSNTDTTSNNLSKLTEHQLQDYSEKMAVLDQLNRHQWNVQKAAKALGINRSTLYRKIKLFQIVSPNDRCQ